MLAIGFVVSFLVAYASVAWFMAWVRKHGFVPFAIYRIVVGILFWYAAKSGLPAEHANSRAVFPLVSKHSSVSCYRVRSNVPAYRRRAPRDAGATRETNSILSPNSFIVGCLRFLA